MRQKIVQIVPNENVAHNATSSIHDLAEDLLFKKTDGQQVQIRLAHRAEDLTDAYTLVHDQYVKRGYQAADPKGVRFTPHFALPTSHTFIASIGAEVVGTLTMVIDGALGLPMEKEYPGEIKTLREQGHRMAELSCLVTRRSKDLPVLLQLFHAAYAYALHQQGVTDFCIAVTNEHQRFYSTALLFEQVGPVKPYASCNSVSAVAMRLHLPSAEQRYFNAFSMRRMLGRFFLGKNGLEQLSKQLVLPNKDAFCTRLAFAHTYLDWPSLYTVTTKQIERAHIESCRLEDEYNAILALQTA